MPLHRGAISAQAVSVSSLGQTEAICPGSHRSRALIDSRHDSADTSSAYSVADKRSHADGGTLLAFQTPSRSNVRSRRQPSTEAIRGMAHFGSASSYEHILIRLFRGASEPDISQVGAAWACPRPTVRTLPAARSDAQRRGRAPICACEGAAAANAASALTLARGPRTVDVTKDATASKVQENVLRRLAERRGPTVKWRRWPVCAGADLLLTAGPGDGIGECGCDL